MKKLAIGIMSLFLVVTGCVPNMNQEEEVVEKEDEPKEEPSIVTSYQLNEENYRTILPYKTSAARGVITDQVANRVDIDEMEEGLKRLSKSHFDPEKYFFREGQYLSNVKTLIDQLNPDKDPFDDKEDVSLKAKADYQKENPRYLSHILEQNFLKKNEDNTVEVVGVSIALALKSVYHFTVDGHQYSKKLDKKKALQAGKEDAQAILEELRKNEELQNVPIMIALYQEEDQASPVPGNYEAVTYAEPPGRMVGDWEQVKEENILFPSKEAEEKYFDDYQMMKRFGEGIAEFFPNYVGYVGKGFYIDENLKQLNIEIPIEFYGKGESVGFTQYVYGLVKETFGTQYDLQIEVTSENRTESLIYRKAGEDEPNVYITN
ncbi:putative lipoprotein YerH [Lentibacillus sp. JNUCC-1]|uniref:CamS family sex pheromone protein n=1 Tax=Lentibacillus sp. JNUCC-1 TaxID=2654513 RepID=UPI0012E7157A|nr:CamS family sex pheromone protein [Lentibacillus sp. JNUCC-1]MUV38601.1 putative lipoprotein YerH [Lentibacillus sp. JNUCC-1]